MNIAFWLGRHHVQYIDISQDYNVICELCALCMRKTLIQMSRIFFKTSFAYSRGTGTQLGNKLTIKGEHRTDCYKSREPKRIRE